MCCNRWLKTWQEKPLWICKICHWHIRVTLVTVTYSQEPGILWWWWWWWFTKLNTVTTNPICVNVLSSAHTTNAPKTSNTLFSSLSVEILISMNILQHTEEIEGISRCPQQCFSVLPSVDYSLLGCSTQTHISISTSSAQRTMQPDGPPFKVSHW